MVAYPIVKQGQKTVDRLVPLKMIVSLVCPPSWAVGGVLCFGLL